MEPLQDTDPRQIGPYEILGLLGAGGMGRVYLGNGENGTKVAVKVVNAELLHNEEFRKRFTREGRATAKVRSEYIARIVDAELDGPHPWIATEYIDGPALSDKVDKQGRLSAAEAQRMAAGLARALTDIHAAGVVHRDVKPANVLIAGDRPRLIDFGIAHHATNSTLTPHHVVVGTPPYMAPEQIRGKRKVGPAADVFSLGGVLTFALTGRHPFGEADAATLAYRIAHEEPDLDGVEDEMIRELIMTCLVKDPGARPTAAELQVALGRLATRPVVVAELEPEPPEPEPTLALGLVPPAPIPEPEPALPVPELKHALPEPEPALPEPEIEEALPRPEPVPEQALPMLEPALSVPEPAPQAEPEADPAESAPPIQATEPPHHPGRRRYLRTAAAIASVALVVIVAVILVDPTTKPGADASTRISTPSDLPTASTTSTDPADSTSSPGATPASSHSAAPGSSGKPSSLSGPGTTATGSQNAPPSTADTSTAPGIVGHTTPTAHTTAAPPPHTSSQPAKPTTSAPPPARNTAPAAPTGAKATVTMDSNYNDYLVTFVWSPVGTATSYDVHYTFIDGNGHTRTDEIDSVTGTSMKAAPFSDPSAQACFVVRAVNAYGTSAWDSGSPHCI